MPRRSFSPRESRANEGGGQGVPGLDFLVGEHDGQDPVVFEHAVHLAEGCRHLALVIGLGEVFFLAPHVREAGDIGDGLVVFVGQFIGEELGVNVAQAAFHPDVEEIRTFGVHHVVVIGRVHIDVVHALVCAMGQIGGTSPVYVNRRTAGLIQEPLLVALGKLGDP